MVLLAAAVVAVAPPLAPDPPPNPVQVLRTQVIEAIRNCPKAPPGEIVVCSRDRGVAEAYRLPRLDPRYAHGETARRGDPSGGIGPAAGGCSTTGSVGATGCALDAANAWGEWKRERRRDSDLP